MTQDFLHRLASEIVFVDAVTLGERGQVAVPAEIRRELALSGGSKLFALRLKDRKGFILLTGEGLAELAKGVPPEALASLFGAASKGVVPRE